MDKLYIDQKKFTSLLLKLVRDIKLSNWKPDYIVGITRGGLTPSVYLSHWLNVPMHTLNISLRDNCFAESNDLILEDAISTNKTNILIVDDINDTGQTFNYLTNDWENKSVTTDWANIYNNNVRFCVLVDNLSSNSKVKMDYSGMEVNKFEKDVWVYFPWEEWWTK
jgi:hypoxanthine phosphoribosyltransferase